MKGFIPSISAQHMISSTTTTCRHYSADTDGSESSRRAPKGLTRSTSINSGVEMIGREDPLESADDDSDMETLTRSLVGSNVHDSYSAKKQLPWRKRPLFSRKGQHVTFESGVDAAMLLVNEAQRRDPYQVDFLQSVEEVAHDVAAAIEVDAKLAWVFKQMMEPERLVTFRVPWTDDSGNSRLNRGYQIQYSSALGIYRGGLRFHPHISHGSIRMLGWEQTLKNALVPIPCGGSKGGSDFDPTDKSDKEIRRFCDGFMRAMAPFVSPETDAFETDLNIGAKEMGYMRETYSSLVQIKDQNDAEVQEQIAALFGGAEDFPESCGYGCVFFARRALQVHLGFPLEGSRCLISGAGSLARSVAEKLLQVGALPLTLSDTSGFILAEDGLTRNDLEAVELLKSKGQSLASFAVTRAKMKFVPAVESGSLWELAKGEVAFPCVSQGEINVDDALALEGNGCFAVFECADRACTPNARILLQDRKVLFAPSKAVNSGSIVCSSTYAQTVKQEGRSPSKVELEQSLEAGMEHVHDVVTEHAERFNVAGDLKAGANLASVLLISSKEMPN